MLIIETCALNGFWRLNGIDEYFSWYDISIIFGCRNSCIRSGMERKIWRVFFKVKDWSWNYLNKLVFDFLVMLLVNNNRVVLVLVDRVPHVFEPGLLLGIGRRRVRHVSTPVTDVTPVDKWRVWALAAMKPRRPQKRVFDRILDSFCPAKKTISKSSYSTAYLGELGGDAPRLEWALLRGVGSWLGVGEVFGVFWVDQVKRPPRPEPLPELAPVWLADRWRDFDSSLVTSECVEELRFG